MAQIGVPTFFPPKSPLSLEKMGFLPSMFSLLWGSAFGATAHDAVHDAAHDAFMTLPPYNSTREEEARHLGRGPQSCRVGLCVRTCPHYTPAYQGKRSFLLY
jgi:hypothetical protein